ncbi:xanthine dehydrogenase family protein molybdopterin-binding subunit [Sphingomonas bacterium]|uniref:xanthine dehydrogenase family protein molybdopterin-binding subunit n=1 Tax=Sphingomonas bacterium TaxID=1895847 RepID=UPI001577327B|nr:xanthine dehydrogenase family protein molybdopterin-binding subunit [Sphingomonas bacterium]
MSLMETAQSMLKKAVALAPDRWMPGGTPDPLIEHKHGRVGEPVSRLDGPLKVSGGAKFAAEFALPDMLYAAILYSTIASGRIVAIHTAEAQTAPGVKLVMTHGNAPRMKAPPTMGTSSKALAQDNVPVMQDDRIHWNGQEVALVLAETQEQADHAKSLIRVDYAPEDAVTSFGTAKSHGLEPASFQGEPLHVAIGDAEQALLASPFQVDALYSTPRHNHNPIELHAVTVAWDGDTLNVHDASQAVVQTAWTLSQVFGVDADQVHVTSPYVGGGFGSKTLWHHHILAGAAARMAGRPVRLVLSREGVYRTVGGRSVTEQRVALGADEEGRFQAIVQTGVTVATPHNEMAEPFTTGTKHTYASKTFLLDQQLARMSSVANTFMRAPGEAVGTFALESAVDELAHALRMDPVELRLRNEPDKDPTSGLPWSARHSVEAWRDGAKAFGWSERRMEHGTRRESEWLVGLGCAAATYPYYRFPGGGARITLTRDGRARIDVAAHEMGMGTATAHTQVMADRLGLPMEQVKVDYGDSSMAGVFMAGGSSQTASIGAAMIAAQRALWSELLKLAGNDSPLAGLSADEIAGDAGGLVKLDDPSRHESYSSILSRAHRDELVVEANASPPLETQHWSMHSHGAVFCEVAVNSVTGEPRVRRVLGSYDCGRILNPKTARSQFRGGIIMGLGLALMEQTEVDERNGRIMNASLSEYHVPVHMDVPDIEVIWNDIPDPHAPMGARGIGEIGITGVGAAVANAVFNATGRRVRDLPITLDKLM